MMEIEETTFQMRAVAAPLTHHFEPCAVFWRFACLLVRRFSDPFLLQTL